jgi:ABC-type amino acid transport substrate-binding protein
MLISGFTAAIASSLTVSQLSSSIDGPEDLRGVRVGSVRSSTSAAYLEEGRILFQEFDNTQKALDELEAGKLDAVVYDQPMLRFLAKKNRYKKVTVLHPTFERQDYAFGLPAASPLRESINHALIERLSSDWWKETLQIYIGN